MSALAVLIRRQRLLAAEHKQRAQRLRAERDALAQTQRSHSERCTALRAHLDSLLDGGAELTLDTPRLTHSALAAALDRAQQLAIDLQKADERASETEREALRAQKRLEKFEERARRARLAALAEHQRREDLALDEWVLSARGGR